MDLWLLSLLTVFLRDLALRRFALRLLFWVVVCPFFALLAKSWRIVFLSRLVPIVSDINGTYSLIVLACPSVRSSGERGGFQCLFLFA